jgi:hypothetical protein
MVDMDVPEMVDSMALLRLERQFLPFPVAYLLRIQHVDPDATASRFQGRQGQGHAVNLIRPVVSTIDKYSPSPDITKTVPRVASCVCTTCCSIPFPLFLCFDQDPAVSNVRRIHAFVYCSVYLAEDIPSPLSQ